MELAAAAPWQMWATLAIIAVGVFFYVLERFPLELVSAAILVALLLLFNLAPLQNAAGEILLTTEGLLAGFASPALFAIVGLLIIGQGMFQSGALEHLTEYLLGAYSNRPHLTVAAVFLIVMVVSAFLNNTPVVVMFIPIIAAMAAQSKVPASRLMMPLSFLSILGGMTTIIGSSTNILAAEAYRKAEPGMDIGFFETTPLGVILAAVGIVYMFTVGRRLMPQRVNPDGDQEAEREGKQFIAQIEIGRGHPLVGEGPVAGLFPQLPDITVRMVQRRDRAILPPFDEFKFRVGDVVIIAATRQALTSLLKSQPEILDGLMSEIDLQDEENGGGARAQLTLVEAVVAPGSRMIGQSISQIGLNFKNNCVILGIERRSRMIRARMNTIRLEAGDVLLILGDIGDVRNLRGNRDILLLEKSMQGLPDPRNARIAAAIFFGVVIAAATGLVSISISAIAGAMLMVATGCLNIRQAARAVDRRIYLLIGASLAMGAALQTTGGADVIGQAIADGAGALGPVALISTFFIICAAMTNVLSNNATAVLFTPIAVSAARQAGLDPHVLVLTVIFAANCSFATPVAYQTNLLVMTAGHYKFRDFVVVGGPLIIIIWLAYTAIAPIYFRMIGMI